MLAKTNSLKSFLWGHDYQREASIVASFGVFVFLMISLVSYSPFDPSPFSFSSPTKLPTNWGGSFGAFFAGICFHYLGFSTFWLLVPPIGIVTLLVKKRENLSLFGRTIGWFGLLVCLATALGTYLPSVTIEQTPYPSAGVLGILLSRFLMVKLGKVGIVIFILTLAAFSSILLTQMSLLTYAGALKALPRFALDQLRGLIPAKKQPKPQIPIVTPKAEPAVVVCEPRILRSAQDDEARHAEAGHRHAEAGHRHAEAGHRHVEAGHRHVEAGHRHVEPQAKHPDLKYFNERPASYKAPSLDVFKSADGPIHIDSEKRAEFEKTGNNLIKAFADFAIEGKIIAIQPGPVVTVYEFEPEKGVKLSKITGLIDDIALAMRVDSIFIHPVSGKRAVGVQIPNTKRETVYLGDILKSAAFQDAESVLTFAMGKSLKGEAVCSNLEAMPHLLIAGQTGSGKSVAINSLLCSIILKASPDQVRMILVDPKILELKVYEDIPHLYMPVITEPLKAAQALKWATLEMDRRYRLMEHAKVRHISGFNRYWEEASDKEQAEIQALMQDDAISKLPYLIVVIDELADLMLTAPKEVESSIQRLAQKARASGIHLILATQRPSVDVITGVIKANLPCRIAFKVFSRGDSRTILDSIGAEKLLGKGDMLFLKPGSKLERIQGAFLEDSEVISLIDEIKKEHIPQYDENAIAWIEETIKDQQQPITMGGSDELDPKWDEAINIGQQYGIVSASFLQRHMKIGYNRAARIVETMQAQGLVEQANGSKPRKWLGSSI
jgi:S-DNA-T family DNA segregation ATPase FtsK/SpoIIIE